MEGVVEGVIEEIIGGVSENNNSERSLRRLLGITKISRKVISKKLYSLCFMCAYSLVGFIFGGDVWTIFRQIIKGDFWRDYE